MQGEPLTGGDSRFDEALGSYSLRAAIAGAAGMDVDWSRERELSAELARRSGRQFQGIAVPMSVFHKPLEKRVVTGAGEGSNLIGTDHLGGQFIDVLRAKMVVRRLGARVLSGLVGNVAIPRLNASATSGWVADNAALSASDPDLNKVQLSPKHCGALTEFSRSTLMQSSPDIEQLLRMDFAGLLAQAVDRAAIKGGGSNEPTGILSTSGVNTSVTMGSTPTWAKVLQIIEAVEVSDGEGTAWATSPSVVRFLRSTAKVSSTDSVMIMQAPNELAGYPLIASTNVPDYAGSPQPHSLIFGNWSDLLIGFWSELDVLVNPYETTAYSKGNVQVRGMMTADVAVRHADSFAACTDLDP
jgi:HK97 family phage major capsid protein